METFRASFCNYWNSFQHEFVRRVRYWPRTNGLITASMAISSHAKRALMLILRQWFSPCWASSPVWALNFCWLKNATQSLLVFKLYDGPVCRVERFRQCVDFVSELSPSFVNAYHVFFLILQFILPTLGTVVCYGHWSAKSLQWSKV